MPPDSPQPEPFAAPEPDPSDPGLGQTPLELTAAPHEALGPTGSSAVDPASPSEEAGVSFPPRTGEPSESADLAEVSGPFGAGTFVPPGAELVSGAQGGDPSAGLEAQPKLADQPPLAPAASTFDDQPPHQAGPQQASALTQPSPAPHEFRSASLLTAAELRRGKLKHEDFARALSTRLSIYLRTEFLAQLNALQVLSHPKLMAALPDPAHFTLFRLDPLGGLGLVAMPVRLSLALVDRLMGGPGQRDHTQRGPTEVERAVLDLVTTQVLKEWSQAVLGTEPAQLQMLGHESHPRFLPLSAPEGQFLLVALEAQLGQLTERFCLALPFVWVEPVFRHSASPAQAAQPSCSPSPTIPLEWHPGLDEIPVTLTAGWEGLRLTAGQLANLKVGDWLPLEPQRFSQVQVRLARQPKFVGRLGAANRTRAVELIGPIESEPPLVS